MFIQDDFKVSSRFTINAGLRYEIFKAETEEDDKIVNFDPVGLRLIYAGEDGASRSVNKKTQYGNFAPRLGLTYDMFGDASRRFCARASPSPTSPSSRRRRT